MSYEQKDNDLVLFKNDKKETDKHPDYKGSGMVNGTEVWLSAWINKSAKGVMYMSLKTQNKDDAHKDGIARTQQAAKAPQDQSTEEWLEDYDKAVKDNFDDDIPF